MTYCYIDVAGDEVCENDAWDDWERWVVLGVVLGAIFLILVGFLIFSCITARKRQRAGIKPYKGTAWTLGVTPPGHNPPTYTKDVELGPPPPPAYANAQNDPTVRPGYEQPVYPAPAQQPYPRGDEPTQ
ncbi:hypothetical protein PRZ48_002505 [Zasmidium cellare]|uniref:Uncharacterized protein n=1 Tax=Zasmidium cellare TaxID=395010 RepID=A0ABR0F6E3_ZASCE|nr:hypothetical protein PRZ48_002505 [Zasmidium cellare]